MAKKREPLPSAPAAAALSSLGDLLRQRGVGVASTPAPAPLAPAPPRSPGELDLTNSAKLVVRRERKGHGGKTVTVIAGLGLRGAALEAVARTLRKALGCGSWVDGDTVVLQGDLAPAAETWLRARGARQVIRAN